MNNLLHQNFKNNFKELFLKTISESGFTLRDDLSDEDASVEEKKKLKKMRKEVSEKNHELISNSKNLSDEEYMNLINNMEKTEEEEYSLSKASLKKCYQVEYNEISAEFVKTYNHSHLKNGFYYMNEERRIIEENINNPDSLEKPNLYYILLYVKNLFKSLIGVDGKDTILNIFAGRMATYTIPNFVTDKKEKILCDWYKETYEHAASNKVIFDVKLKPLNKKGKNNGFFDMLLKNKIQYINQTFFSKLLLKMTNVGSNTYNCYIDDRFKIYEFENNKKKIRKLKVNK